MAAIIPDKVYVTVQYRRDIKTESQLLGFLSPYTKDAAFEKRKQTQDNWAYGRNIEVNIDQEDNVTVTGKDHDQKSKNDWDPGMLFINNCYPRIVLNEPIEGFQLSKTVRRYGWNGSGNVVWRITDPRGFDIEISSENFASIVTCADLEQGLIKGKCVWGREGSKNILLPESSEPYIEAIKQTKKISSKVSLRDVKPGDHVEIISASIDERNHSCIFYGKFYFLTANDDGNKHSFNSLQSEKYLFFGLGTNSYFTLGSPKISSIVKPAEIPEDKLALAKKLSLDQSFLSDICGYVKCLLISPTKIDLSKITIDLEKVDFTYSDLIKLTDVKSDYRTYRCFVVKSDQGLLTNYRYYCRSADGKKVNLIHIDYDQDHRLVTFKTQVKPTNFYYGRSQPNYEIVTTTDYDDSTLEFFEIKVRYNEIEGKLTNW